MSVEKTATTSPSLDPATIKIFAMNDSDWYAAATAEDALREMAELMSYEATPEGIAAMRKEFELEDPRELDAEEMSRQMFLEEEEDGTVDADRKITFRQRLDQLIAAGAQFPSFFASTEF